MIIWGYITMDFEQDVMDGEIDKVINIHAIMMGRQLILCKRRDITHESAYVFLWPGEGIYTDDRTYFNRRYKNDLQRHGKVFLLSNTGSQYQRDNSIQVVTARNQYTKTIATVEYYRIRPNRQMFEELKQCGEFALWDIDDGPMRYFTRPNGEPWQSGYIALYRAYKIPMRLRHDDINFRRGLTPRLKENSFERIKGEIINDRIDPIEAVRITDENDILRRTQIRGDHFEERREKILKIINQYPPIN